MARKLFVLAMLLTACAVGVFGYQIGYYWIIGSWPPVPVRAVWLAPFAPDGGGAAAWVGGVPISLALLVLAFLAYFISDQLRLR